MVAVPPSFSIVDEEVRRGGASSSQLLLLHASVCLHASDITCVMGGSHGKEVKDPSPSPQPSPNLRKVIVPPPTTAQTLQALLQPSRLEKHTLDRTLKGFLKHCNLTGLEYRLRIAGK